MRWWVPSLWFLGIGWYFATCIAIGVFAGNWLDGQAGRAPLFTLLGLCLGLAVGLYGSIRMLLQFLSTTGQNGNRGQ